MGDRRLEQKGQRQVAFKIHSFPQTGSKQSKQASNFSAKCISAQLLVTFRPLYRIPTVKAVPLFAFIRNKFRCGPFIKTSPSVSFSASIRNLDCFGPTASAVWREEQPPACFGGPVLARSHKSSARKHMLPQKT